MRSRANVAPCGGACLDRRELGPQVAPQIDPAGLVIASEGMRRVVDLARRVAQVDSTVLVTGESGVGKERVARLIHDASARAGGPFVAINCGAVPEGLLESELFGHARGAFTGAAQDRPGLFEAASGGTLLLDEIGDVPPPMQVKLLRALQEREVRRVGENRDRKVDFGVPRSVYGAADQPRRGVLDVDRRSVGTLDPLAIDQNAPPRRDETLGRGTQPARG